MVKLILLFATVLCFATTIFSSDFLSFGGKIGFTDGWGYDQNTYNSTLTPGLAGGIFVDYNVLKFFWLSLCGLSWVDK
jgi:hypothetical protein